MTPTEARWDEQLSTARSHHRDWAGEETGHGTTCTHTRDPTMLLLQMDDSISNQDDTKVSPRQAISTNLGHRGGYLKARDPCLGPQRGVNPLLTLALSREVSRDSTLAGSFSSSRTPICATGHPAMALSCTS